MPRLNIEDSIFKDLRFIKLQNEVGNYYTAIGLLVTGWTLAQQNWLKHGCIPAENWFEDLDILITCKLAIKQADGSIYMKGSQKQFAWLTQCSQAGKRGGLSNSKAKTKMLKQYAKTVTTVSVEHSKTETTVKPPTPTLTHTLNNLKNITKIEEGVGGFKESEVYKNWLRIYKDESFIDATIAQCKIYYQSKPEKTPTTPTRWFEVVGRWLKKDFHEMKNKNSKTVLETLYERNPENTKDVLSMLERLKNDKTRI